MKWGLIGWCLGFIFTVVLWNGIDAWNASHPPKPTVKVKPVQPFKVDHTACKWTLVKEPGIWYNVWLCRTGVQ